jgi:hypothetical protein
MMNYFSEQMDCCYEQMLRFHRFDNNNNNNNIIIIMIMIDTI